MGQQRFTLLHRKGTKGFTPSGTSGAFKCIQAQYKRLPSVEDLGGAADAHTDGFQYDGYKLSRCIRRSRPRGSFLLHCSCSTHPRSADRYDRRLVPASSVCPGRGQGMGDVPSLKILGDADPSDITQGGVGDCWLLSGISSLAEFDGAIKHLFRRTQGIGSLPASTPNTYTITLWDLPTWKEVDVVIDERLARKADGSGLLGCEMSRDGELWVCYLEKAIAVHVRYTISNARHVSSLRIRASSHEELTRKHVCAPPSTVRAVRWVGQDQRRAVHARVVDAHGLQGHVYDPQGQRRRLWLFRRLQPE